MTWRADETGRIYTGDLEVGRMVTPELAQTVAELVNTAVRAAAQPDRIAQIRAQAGYPRSKQ